METSEKSNGEKIRLARLAISDLYLDSEISDSDIEFIARRLKQTELPITELQRIFEEEVAPAVYLNAYSVAGVWGQFDSDWLEKRIEEKRRWIAFVKRLSPIWSLYRRWVTRPANKDWKRVLAKCGIPDIAEHLSA